METFLVEARAVSCESYSQVLGGRCTLASMLGSLCGPAGLGPALRGPANSWIRCEDAGKNGRVAAMAKMPFSAERPGLPKETVRVPLGEWLPPSWCKVLESPDRMLLAGRPGLSERCRELTTPLKGKTEIPSFCRGRRQPV